jgi:hypothetical protein
LKILLKILIFFTVISISYGFFLGSEWGFFAHKRINRMAVYILPPEMMYFFKPNIEYITEHATDPDKLKFTNSQEGIRHFIDIDHWGEYPFDSLPRDWVGAISKYAEVSIIDEDSTLLLFGPGVNIVRNDTLFGSGFSCLNKDYRNFIAKKIAYSVLNDKIEFPADSLNKWINIQIENPQRKKIRVVENFSQDGILPYYIHEHYRSLVKAFQNKDPKRILRLASHMGHYIGDAHVPLHTTKNYNGQLTNQVGIHAFWENSIPELLCDPEFDFFVGKAEYIKNIREFIWDIVLKSHSLKNDVLRADSLVNLHIPDEKKFVFKERNGIVVRSQSEILIRAFDKELKNMAEQRMRNAVKALGDIWYTAWIDAGQPDLRQISNIRWSEEELREQENLKNNPGNGVLHGCGAEH